MKPWWDDNPIYIDGEIDDTLICPAALLQNHRRILNDRLNDPDWLSLAVRRVGQEEALKIMAQIREMVAYFDFNIEFLGSVNIDEWRELNQE